MTANRQGTTKKKRRGPGKPFAKGLDPRRNLAGRPALGESYKEIFTNVGNLSISELRERYPTYGDRFDNVDGDIKLKDLVVLSVLATLACDPSPGMLATLLDRTDGPLEHTININRMTNEELANVIKPILERLGIRLESPSSGGLPGCADSGDKPA